jgi:hypothetical protein
MKPADHEVNDRTPMEQPSDMNWAWRLKRVFNIDITECEKCKGPVRKVWGCTRITGDIKPGPAKQTGQKTSGI